MEKKLYIAILYHHHQPYYKDPLTGMYHLPWVRLHAIKDYYDMCIWVEKFVNLKLNFNLVPSLLIQLEDYSKDAFDKELLLTLKPVQDLTDDDKVYMLRNFFNCNYHTMILPYQRYKELFDKRGKINSLDELYRKIKYFNNQDWIDLQMWSNLVWFDYYFRENDKEIKSWFEKKTNFTQQDKEIMVKKQRYICGEIIKKYRQLQNERKIEVSVSAFYHPILPLLCDPQKAKISSPNMNLPKYDLSLIEDAEEQISSALEYYNKNFRCLPKGFWPSEGAVSEDVVKLVSDSNILWIASDEEILRKSIYLQNDIYPPKEVIYQHYKINLDNTNKPIYAIFRDRELSDNIGFVYYRWGYKDAVADFERRLLKIYEDVYEDKNKKNALVSIILDGENCWEFYPNDGYEFLNEFYNMLTNNKIFETVLISDFILKNPQSETLTKIWPGSWINANYNIWIGHDEDNTAWDYLYKTRNFLIEYLKQHSDFVDEKTKSLCWQEIYTAEGSDWFWWFGDEHYTPQSDIFDFLFRQHLKNVYILLKQQPPKFLDIPIKRVFKKFEYTLPADLISPKIDGKISNYFEWSSAGRYIVSPSSMHQTTNVINAVYFGFDLGSLFIRIDFEKEKMEEDLTVNVFLVKKKTPQEIYSVKFLLKRGNNKYKFFTPENFMQEVEYLSIDKIIELQIPFCLIKTFPSEEIQFFITVEKTFENKNFEIERVPSQEFIELVHPDKSYIKRFWTV